MMPITITCKKCKTKHLLRDVADSIKGNTPEDKYVCSCGRVLIDFKDDDNGKDKQEKDVSSSNTNKRN